MENYEGERVLHKVLARIEKKKEMKAKADRYSKESFFEEIKTRMKVRRCGILC